MSRMLCQRMTQAHQVAILVPLAVGVGAVLCTLMIHGLAVLTNVNFVRYERRRGRIGVGFRIDFAIVVVAMMLVFVAHLIEMAMWAGLFLICGEFHDLGTAYCFSAGNYTTLGCGDLIMSPSWKLLGPLEAADGALMFGVSTAMIFTVIVRLIEARFEDLRTGL
jgi:hypothetical protein